MVTRWLYDYRTMFRSPHPLLRRETSSGSPPMAQISSWYYDLASRFVLGGLMVD
jgi:hypothetical protein